MYAARKEKDNYQPTLSPRKKAAKKVRQDSRGLAVNHDAQERINQLDTEKKSSSEFLWTFIIASIPHGLSKQRKRNGMLLKNRILIARRKGQPRRIIAHVL